MSKKQPSPSSGDSTTSSLGASSPQSSKSRGSDDQFLIVRKQPPTFLFSEESFDVEIALDPTQSSPSSNGGGSPSSLNRRKDITLELEASLKYLKGGSPRTSEATISVDPSATCTHSNLAKGVKFRCVIHADNLQRKDALAIVFSSKRIKHEKTENVTTTSVTIVNYKTKISLEEAWGDTFYKDEGGRDKSLVVHAGIYDRNDQLQVGQQVPLQLKLCYSSKISHYVPVSNQNVLKVLGTSKAVIDKATGKARIRYRIEDVSKNHQGQSFSLEVTPDPKATKFMGIVAPGFTPPVSVRSKRNKRARSTSASRSASGRKGSPATAPVRQQHTPATDERSSGVRPPSSREPSIDDVDIVRLRDAMKGVINWADEVVNGLFPLQWEVVGYAQNENGSSDPSRPFYNMVNPNGAISRILNTYTESVRDDLRTLVSHVEATTRSQSDSQMYSSGNLPFSSPTHPQAMRAGMPPPAPAQPVRASLPPGMIPPSMNMRGSDHQRDMEYLRSMPLPHQQYARQPFEQQVQTNPNMMNHGALSSTIDDDSHQPLPAYMHRMDGAPLQAQIQPPSASMQAFDDDEDTRESEVEYVLAKQFKALRTGERLGFPAYSANKEILGFYRESNTKVGVGQFTPISSHQNEFGPLEILQATEILQEAIAKKSGAVHALKDWGSIAALMDHALVYDWSKDIGSSSEESPANP